MWQTRRFLLLFKLHLWLQLPQKNLRCYNNSMAIALRKQIARNKINTIIAMAVFVALVSLIGWLFAWLFSNPNILLWCVVISTIYALFQYFFSDKLAIASAGAKEADPDEQSRYFRIVKKLTEDAKVPMPRLYIINDSAPNAFATGRDPEHSAIAVTVGLLEIMDDKELRAVLAHELSHVRNFDIRVSMITFGLTSVVGLLSDFGLRVLWYSDRDTEDNSPVGMLFVLLVLALSPLISVIVQLAISRQREYLADASSVSITGDADSMINALRKLDAHNRPMRQQNVATEAMYISNPLKKSVLSRFFSTHPPIEARIERLESVKK